MSVEAVSDLAVPPAGHRAAGLAVLGDSSAVGLGDPLPGGGWRGFGPLLAQALGPPGEVRYTNLSFTGARMSSLRQRQLPSALRVRPDVAVIIAGMNDTLRPDFDPVSVREDLQATITALQDCGAVVLATRFHEHARVFRLPGPLRRALHQRVTRLNEATQQAVDRTAASCLDLHRVPGVYDTAAWSVDRLHPLGAGTSDARAGLCRVVAGSGHRRAVFGRFELLRRPTRDGLGPRRLAGDAGCAVAGSARTGISAVCRHTDAA